MKEKVKKFYEEHEEVVDTLGSITVFTVILYGLTIPYLVILKKLGLMEPAEK